MTKHRMTPGEAREAGYFRSNIYPAYWIDRKRTHRIEPMSPREAEVLRLLDEAKPHMKTSLQRSYIDEAIAKLREI